MRNLLNTMVGGTSPAKEPGLMLAIKGERSHFIVLKNSTGSSPPPKSTTQQLQATLHPGKIRDIIYGNEKKVVSTAGTLRTTVATLQRHMARLRSPLKRESGL